MDELDALGTELMNAILEGQPADALKMPDVASMLNMGTDRGRAMLD